MTMHLVGDNAPGYLPDSEPLECDSFEDASAALIHSMLLEADMASDVQATALALAAEDVNLWAETDADLARHGRIGLTAGGREWWIAREVES